MTDIRDDELQDLIDHLYQRGLDTPAEWRAALAARGLTVVREGELDVERLRLAMRDVPDEDPPFGDPPGEWMRGRTPEEVAAEYARLARQPEGQ